jgi:hypothetical protein
MHELYFRKYRIGFDRYSAHLICEIEIINGKIRLLQHSMKSKTATLFNAHKQDCDDTRGKGL